MSTQEEEIPTNVLKEYQQIEKIKKSINFIFNEIKLLPKHEKIDS